MNLIDERKAELQFPIAVVVSRFNEEITGALLKGALTRLEELGFDDGLITVVWVPGAVEIPLVTKKLAEKSNVEAIVTLGAVIRGETDHYDYVCQQVSQGCQQVALANDIPVIFGILTTNDEPQAVARLGKGAECVDAAVEMVNVLRRLR